jgi:hypothetical protein
MIAEAIQAGIYDNACEFNPQRLTLHSEAKRGTSRLA